MKKSFMETPHRYLYAPRTLSEAFKDVEYSTPIHVYKDEDPTFANVVASLLGLLVMIAIAICFN